MLALADEHQNDDNQNIGQHDQELIGEGGEAVGLNGQLQGLRQRKEQRAAEDAASIDRRVLVRFLQSDLVARMLAAPTLLREYEFISRIPAGLLADETAGAQRTDTVFLLGIADCILVHGDTAELVDYKTDHGKTPEQFLQAYATQLALYRDAIEKRLRVRVTRSVIYSFALGQEIEVP